jgi:mono/diheme cytochrome c family protein
LGLTTPPVGAVLFVGCAIGRIPMEQVMRTIWPFYGAILLALLFVPPAMIYKLRVTGSRIPRIHLIHDMDHQPKFKTQKINRLFADGRASRPQVFGTVARGQQQADDQLYRGLLDSAPLMALVSMQQAGPAAAAMPAAGAPAVTTDPAAPPALPVDPLDALPWVSKFPVAVSEATMRRGQERYNVYCSSCHGLAGDGDGLVTLRALELDQGTWIKPVSYHSDQVRNQPIGRLFHSITNGVRKMPAMGDVIPTEDRWAILLYLRALQRARQGTLNDVPSDRLEALQAS